MQSTGAALQLRPEPTEGVSLPSLGLHYSPTPVCTQLHSVQPPAQRKAMQSWESLLV